MVTLIDLQAADRGRSDTPLDTGAEGWYHRSVINSLASYTGLDPVSRQIPRTESATAPIGVRPSKVYCSARAPRQVTGRQHQLAVDGIAAMTATYATDAHYMPWVLIAPDGREYQERVGKSLLIDPVKWPVGWRCPLTWVFIDQDGLDHQRDPAQLADQLACVRQAVANAGLPKPVIYSTRGGWRIAWPLADMTADIAGQTHVPGYPHLVVARYDVVTDQIALLKRHYAEALGGTTGYAATQAAWLAVGLRCPDGAWKDQSGTESPLTMIRCPIVLREGADAVVQPDVLEVAGVEPLVLPALTVGESPAYTRAMDKAAKAAAAEADTRLREQRRAELRARGMAERTPADLRCDASRATAELDRACARIAALRDDTGCCNTTTNAVIWGVGQLVPHLLDEQVALQALEAACYQTGMPDREIRGLLPRSLHDGMRTPRHLDPTPEQDAREHERAMPRPQHRALRDALRTIAPAAPTDADRAWLADITSTAGWWWLEGAITAEHGARYDALELALLLGSAGASTATMVRLVASVHTWAAAVTATLAAHRAAHRHAQGVASALDLLRDTEPHRCDPWLLSCPTKVPIVQTHQQTPAICRVCGVDCRTVRCPACGWVILDRWHQRVMATYAAGAQLYALEIPGATRERDGHRLRMQRARAGVGTWLWLQDGDGAIIYTAQPLTLDDVHAEAVSPDDLWHDLCALRRSRIADWRGAVSAAGVWAIPPERAPRPESHWDTVGVAAGLWDRERITRAIAAHGAEVSDTVGRDDDGGAMPAVRWHAEPGSARRADIFGALGVVERTYAAAAAAACGVP